MGEQLQRLQQQGLEWLARTNRLLSSRSEYSPEVVVELMAKGEALPLQLPALAQLRTALDAARGWQETAAELLASSKPTGQWLPQHCVPMEQLAALLTKPEAQVLALPIARPSDPRPPCPGILSCGSPARPACPRSPLPTPLFVARSCCGCPRRMRCATSSASCCGSAARTA